MSPPSPTSPHRRPRQAIGGTQEDVRRHNLATMLGHLHVAGPLRRADLTGLMGLNRSTIAALVAELAALGAVREERPEGTQAGAGRPSLVVTPRASRVQVLAADVGIGRVSVALVGLGGVVVARRRRQVGAPSPEAVPSCRDAERRTAPPPRRARRPRRRAGRRSRG